MANYSAIKAAVNAYIKANGKKEITGRILNSVLNATIDSLGKEFQFRGALTPADDPGQPDQNVAYIGAAGTYSNFDNLVIESGNIGIFLWNGDWSFATIPVGKDYDNDIQSLTNGLQELSENIQELSDNVIHLDGINEEDLSIPEGGKLQFANRAYNAQQPNGMGYVILRKNKTFAEQVTKENTIYEIRYDFDLNNASVTIPAGCVLNFNGGELTNGTIVGNNTGIDGNKTGIFGATLTPSGSWLIHEINSKMFKSLQASNALRKLFALNNANIQTHIVIEKESYDYPVAISEDADVVFDVLSNTIVEINGTIKLAANAFPHYRIFGIHASNIVICGGGAVYGDAPNHIIESGSHEWGHVISIYGERDSFVSNIIISGILAADGAGDSINVSYADNLLINNVKCDGSRRLGISLTDVNNTTIDGAIIKNISGTNPQYAIDIEPNESNAVYENIIVRNVIASNCAGGTLIISSKRADTITKNVRFENIFDDSQTSKISLAKCENVSIIGSIVNNITIAAKNNRVIRSQCATMSILTGYYRNVIDGCIVSSSLSVTGENIVINSKLAEVGLSVVETEDSIKPLLLQNNFIEYIYGFYRNVSIVGNFFAKIDDTHNKFITRQKRNFSAFGVITIENNTFFIDTGKSVQRLLELASNGAGDNVICKFLNNDIHVLGTLSASLVNNAGITTFIADEQGLMTGNIPTTFALGTLEFHQRSVPALATRPTKCLFAGLSIFDITLGKMIVWNGTTWVNMDGSALS